MGLYSPPRARRREEPAARPIGHPVLLRTALLAARKRRQQYAEARAVGKLETERGG